MQVNHSKILVCEELDSTKKGPHKAVITAQSHKSQDKLTPPNWCNEERLVVEEIVFSVNSSIQPQLDLMMFKKNMLENITDNNNSVNPL
jgi:hypothetical protein